MFNNTRIKITSTSYTENGEEFPFINSINYTSDFLGNNLFENKTYYLNKENDFYIKFSFNKEVIISENTKVRVLFNNNTFIDEEITGGKTTYFVVKGDNTIHYEKELKVVDLDLINGYIKDESNHQLNTNIKEEIINQEESLFVLNNKPFINASSEKNFYTSNKANIILNTNEELIDSYCISEDSDCLDYLKYESNKVDFVFDIGTNDKEVCVYIKDKANNISNCSLVKFNYYPFPEFEFVIEEGNIVNNNTIHINIETKENNYINLESYCLFIDGECNKKVLNNSIKEILVIDENEGNKLIKFILFDDKDNKFEYEHLITLDISKPELQVEIINEDIVSNYKDLLINYSDNISLNENNLYQYYLSTSSSTLEGSRWIDYENNKMFRIRNVSDGNYYLWIRNASDSASNKYSDEDYILISKKLSFDNTKPIININTSEKEVDKDNLVKEFIITYNDYNEIKETILDKSSLIVNCTNDAKYKINIVSEIANGWIIEVVFEKESISSGYFSLTVLSNLIEDIAGNRNDSLTSSLIKIN